MTYLFELAILFRTLVYTEPAPNPCPSIRIIIEEIITILIRIQIYARSIIIEDNVATVVLARIWSLATTHA
jgi:hypothetical protein